MEIDRLLWLWLVPALFGLLHLTALIMALIYYRRCPAACGLVMTASIMNLTVTIARVVFQAMFLGNLPPHTYGLVMAAFSLVSWLGYGLLIVAVFVGRTPPERYRSLRPMQDDDDDWDKPVSAAPAAGGTGIQERK